MYLVTSNVYSENGSVFWMALKKDQKELQNRILGVVPHAVIFSEEPIKDYEILISKIKTNDGVIEAVPFISFQALATYETVSKGISINGITL